MTSWIGTGPLHQSAQTTKRALRSTDSRQQAMALETRPGASPASKISLDKIRKPRLYSSDGRKSSLDRQSGEERRSPRCLTWCNRNLPREVQMGGNFLI